MFHQLYCTIFEFFQMLAESQQAQPIVIPVQSQSRRTQPHIRNP
jgi:hypothetical protein